MKRIASVAVCLGVFFVLITVTSSWSQEPIKIGFAYVFSGRLAHYGFGARQGAELAMDEINRSGGVLGRKLVGDFADTKLKPKIGVEAITKLVKEDKVDVVVGIVSSAVAEACAPVVNRLSTPLIITLAMTPDVTGSKCNPYTFRVSLNVPQDLLGAAVLASTMHVKRWTTIGPDYIYGYQSWGYFKKFLQEKRQDVTFASDRDIAYAPVTTYDFTPYITKVMDSDADGVLVSLYGGNLVDFVNQANNLGFFNGKRQVLMNLAYSADVMFGLGLDMPKGVWLGGLYWFQQNSTPVNTQFVDSYVHRYTLFPDYNAQGGYAGVKAYAAAVEKAGSTDKQKVIKALEGLVIDLPQGRTLIRAGDHQAVVESAWGKTGEFSGKWRSRMLDPLRIFAGEDITPPLETTGCKMR
jgi:branched-chain amino acid transport system substrate-binding protein